jgi:hypothetical protein
MPKKQLWIVPALLAFCLLPCSALSLQRSVSSMLDSLARDFLVEGKVLSRVGIGVLEIRNDSPLAKERELGATVKTLVEKAIGNSLVFKLLDRSSLEASFKEIELSLSDTSGTTQPRTLAIEAIEYYITGSIAEEEERFQVRLRLIKTDTARTIASATSSFPMSELVANDDMRFKPFGFIGPYGTLSWDVFSLSGNTQFGDFMGSGGVATLIPMKNMYAKLGAFGIYAEGDQAGNRFGNNLPATVSGINRVAAIYGYAGLGALVPIAHDAYGHLGLDFGLGWDRKRILYNDNSTPGVVETNFKLDEGCIYWQVNAGMVIKLVDFLALDIQIGLGGMHFGVWPAPKAVMGGLLLVPLSLALVYPY